LESTLLEHAVHAAVAMDQDQVVRTRIAAGKQDEVPEMLQDVHVDRVVRRQKPPDLRVDVVPAATPTRGEKPLERREVLVQPLRSSKSHRHPRGQVERVMARASLALEGVPPHAERDPPPGARALHQDVGHVTAHRSRSTPTQTTLAIEHPRRNGPPALDAEGRGASRLTSLLVASFRQAAQREFEPLERSALVPVLRTVAFHAHAEAGRAMHGADR
jgi:hypothetical protein